jgi:hypothetical protein
VQLDAATSRVHADYYALHGQHRMLDGEHAGEWAWARRTPTPAGSSRAGGARSGRWRSTGTAGSASWAPRPRSRHACARCARTSACSGKPGCPTSGCSATAMSAWCTRATDPTPGRRLAENLLFARGGGGPAQAVRRAGLVPFKVVMNLRALLRRPSRRRLLLGAAPNLAAHLENGVLPLGQDWERVAADTAAWMAQRSAPTGGPPRRPRARGRRCGASPPRPAMTATAVEPAVRPDQATRPAVPRRRPTRSGQPRPP